MKRFFVGFFVVVAALAVIGGLIFLKLGQFKYMGEAGAQMVMPPTTVTSAKAEQEEWPDTIPAIGTVVAVQGVDLSSELSGSVTEIRFESGQEVRVGDVLLRLDASAEISQLQAAEAAAELARLDLERSKELLGNKVISQSELDSKDSAYKQATAQVENLKATVAKKTITAPFSGTLGLRRVNKGEYLNAGTSITNLQALTPVYVDFMIPQQELSRVKEDQKIIARSDAYPDKEFSGLISALDASVDSTTRSIKVRATIANTEKLLRPGMFVNLEIVMPQPLKVLSIPATAVAYEPYGDSVYVIEKGKDGQAEGLQLRRQVIRVGEARGDFVAVIDGLKPGEEVASTGVFKLRNEMPVVVDNKLAPNPSLTPKPKEG